MVNYRNTLNLPKTSFSMKANLGQLELRILKHWQAIGLYETSRKVASKRQQRYVLHDGPPYANGDIHLGHVVNKVLKDIIVKSQLISGKDAPYTPGWDCHGLPIEVEIEKKRGRPETEQEAILFRKACRAYALKQVNRQRRDFERLGIMGDWQNPYLTMDYKIEANIIRSFGRLYEKGYITQGFKPVHWCTDCASALAEAEVEYKEKTSTAVDVRFKVNSSAQLAGLLSGAQPLSVVIWTTTPWTLPANQAVALNPKAIYVVVECTTNQGREYLIVAQELLESVSHRCSLTDLNIVQQLRGEQLSDVKLQHPFMPHEVPLLCAPHVTLETGTGAVHTAPDHGQDDYRIGQDYQLPTLNLVNEQGIFNQSVPFVHGLKVMKADPTIVKVLEEAGALLHSEAYKHSYPHCWRHKTPLLFRATPQWFISMAANHLLQRAESSLAEVQWLPPNSEKHMEAMLSGRPDWCISRQRSWGVPIPLLIHKQDNTPHPRSEELIEEIAQRVEKAGIECWFELQPQDLLGSEGKNYQRLNYTLDVWFDSGVTHASVLREFPYQHFPADMYLEGSDQHRGWFQSSLLTALADADSPPYKAVLTHGYTVDSEGRKMSKSLGNVIAPQTVIKDYGAEILRLWVASTDYRNEIAVSDDIFRATSDVYRRIRNTVRFMLSNLYDFTPTSDALEVKDLLPLDRWVLASAAELQKNLISTYHKYHFAALCKQIHLFCLEDMGGFYLDIIKDRLYVMPSNSHGRRSAQTVLWHILEALVRWLAPLISFTAEEIWQALPPAADERPSSVFLTTWYDFSAILPQDSEPAQTTLNQLKTLKQQVNKSLAAAKAQDDIDSGLSATLHINLPPPLHELLAEMANELHYLLIVSQVTLGQLPRGTNNDAHATQEQIATQPLDITVTRSAFTKCQRCWHHRSDVGDDLTHPELCGRCIDNITGNGEVRQWF